MSAKLIFLAGLLGVGGYVGHTVMTYDPTVVPYSKAQVEAMLAHAQVAMPRRDGDGTIRIWGTGVNSRGVGLAMKYAEADWAPLITCEAVITEIGPNQSRVVADCGSSGGSSALAKTQDELKSPMFEEFIQSRTEKREFNRSKVDSKEMGAVMRNMGGMQREALKMSDETQRMQAEADNSSESSGSGQSSAGSGSDSQSESR